MTAPAIKRIQFVGFAGHRAVPDRAAAKEAILRELELVPSEMNDEFVGISSAASGADLLFLDACRELGMKTVILLPFARERFIDDFDDPKEWNHACECIGAAWWTEVCPGGEAAPEAYHVVAREILDVAVRMIFLWDGQPPRGLGGTAESVAEARKMMIPSRIIDTATLVARWEINPPLTPGSDPTFDDLPPAADVRELFELLDRRAAGSAPKSRGFAAASMSLNHLAGVTQAVMVAFAAVAAEAGAMIKLVLVTLASWLPRLGKTLRWQKQWVRDRVRAELLRSLLATHEPGSPLHPPAIELFEKEKAFLQTAALRLVPSRLGWQAARDAYLDERMDGQIRYLQAKGDLAGRRMRIFGKLFTIASLGAVTLGAVVVVMSFMGGKAWRPLSLASDILPGFSAWLLAMISVFEFKRRANLYHQLVKELKRLRPIVASAQCASEVTRGMRQVERLLLNELWEWQGTREK